MAFTPGNLVAQGDQFRAEFLRKHIEYCYSGQVEKCKETYTEDSFPELQETADLVGKSLDDLIRGWKLPGKLKGLRIAQREPEKILYMATFEGTKRQIAFFLVRRGKGWKVSVKELADLFEKAFETILEKTDDDSPIKPSPKQAPRKDSKTRQACKYRTKGQVLGSLNVSEAFSIYTRFKTTNKFDEFMESGTEASFKAVEVLSKSEGLTIKEYVISRKPVLLSLFTKSKPNLRVSCDDGKRVYFEGYDNDTERWVPMLVVKTKKGWVAAPQDLVEEIVEQVSSELD